MAQLRKVDFYWANDAMNGFVPAPGAAFGRKYYDDRGFTNDLTLKSTLEDDDDRWVTTFRHRMITERVGPRRVDEVTLELRREPVVRRWLNGELRVTYGLGAVATGPEGGAGIQSEFHRVTRSGKTLAEGLPHIYDGDVNVAPRFVGGVSVSQNLTRWTRLSAGVEASLNPGVSASHESLWASAEQSIPLPLGQVTLEAGVAVRAVQSHEARVSFPGGYPTSAGYVQPWAGARYEVGPLSTGFTLQMNVEGSQNHQGVAQLGYKI
jgi:hypothetical protein